MAQGLWALVNSAGSGSPTCSWQASLQSGDWFVVLGAEGYFSPDPGTASRATAPHRRLADGFLPPHAGTLDEQVDDWRDPVSGVLTAAPSVETPALFDDICSTDGMG